MIGYLWVVLPSYIHSLVIAVLHIRWKAHWWLSWIEINVILSVISKYGTIWSCPVLIQELLFLHQPLYRHLPLPLQFLLFLPDGIQSSPNLYRYFSPAFSILLVSLLHPLLVALCDLNFVSRLVKFITYIQFSLLFLLFFFRLFLKFRLASLIFGFAFFLNNFSNSVLLRLNFFIIFVIFIR